MDDVLNVEAELARIYSETPKSCRENYDWNGQEGTLDEAIKLGLERAFYAGMNAGRHMRIENAGSGYTKSTILRLK